MAIVTGGGNGIGAGIATRLAEDGLTVVIADLNLASAVDLAAEIVARGQSAIGLSVDVANPNSVAAMVDQVVEQFGRIHVLVNNAAILGPRVPTVEFPLDGWRQVLQVNLDGTFLCARAVLPHMIACKYGRIVNISSVSGKEGEPVNLSAYVASKAGVIGFTKVLAREVAAHGILVNCVTPGGVKGTGMTGGPDSIHRRDGLENVPLGRWATPADVAALVSWLSSDECSFSTGAVFDVTGGRAKS